jgi:hypothetical protein
LRAAAGGRRNPLSDHKDKIESGAIVAIPILSGLHHDLRFTPRAGLEQSNERATKQSEQLDHRATASPDSHRWGIAPSGRTRISVREAEMTQGYK